LSFFIKKIINSFFVLLGVIAIVFFLFFVILPADPARLTMGQRSDAKSIANIRKELYLDKPLPKQFALYLNDLSPIAIHEKSDEAREKYHYTSLFSVGDSSCLAWKAPYLRRSYQTKKEVNSMLLEAFPGTLVLASLSIFFASILGIFLGAIAALKKNTWMDTAAIFTSILGISAPSFFAGILIAYIFGFLLHDFTGLSSFLLCGITTHIQVDILY
jgi:peptide/nickel transport system permease protein